MEAERLCTISVYQTIWWFPFLRKLQEKKDIGKFYIHHSKSLSVFHSSARNRATITIHLTNAIWAKPTRFLSLIRLLLIGIVRLGSRFIINRRWMAIYKIVHLLLLLHSYCIVIAISILYAQRAATSCRVAASLITDDNARWTNISFHNDTLNAIVHCQLRQ